MLLTIICYFYFLTIQILYLPIVAFHWAVAKNNPFQLISEFWLIFKIIFKQYDYIFVLCSVKFCFFVMHFVDCHWIVFIVLQNTMKSKALGLCHSNFCSGLGNVYYVLDTTQLFSISNSRQLKAVPLVEFVYFVFTHIPGESYCRWFRSLLCSYNGFQVLINSLRFLIHIRLIIWLMNIIKVFTLIFFFFFRCTIQSYNQTGRDICTCLWSETGDSLAGYRELAIIMMK